MQAFFQGILIGLTITVSIGPACLALLQTSILKGIKAGFILAIGILMSDLVLISTCYFGLSKILIKENSIIMVIIAGTIMISAGTFSLFQKSSVNIGINENSSGIQNRLVAVLAKGFLLNIANPFVLIFWIGIMSFAVSNYGMHSNGFFIFFLGLILTGFSSDLIKCRLSGFIKKLLNNNTISIFNKGIGIVFIAIGIFFICKIFK